jgi:hypothetical protein
MTLQLVETSPIVTRSDMDEIYTLIKEFNKAYEVGQSTELRDLYVKLVEEEHEEWVTIGLVSTSCSVILWPF